ncbi:hypothetical protein LZC95_47870 [Pendulispora brunnea]|uniref:Uncharacterized protein n=1 Tax=Pendulispora brunnea TaxID=2905690 RepID=A0ABZ2K637_9BACT
MKRVTVENIVCEAYRLLGDLEDVVTSSRQIGYGATHEQASTLADMQLYLVRIKAALGKMESTAASEPGSPDSGMFEMADTQTEALAGIGHDLSDVRVALRRIQGTLQRTGDGHVFKTDEVPPSGKVRN